MKSTTMWHELFSIKEIFPEKKSLQITDRLQLCSGLMKCLGIAIKTVKSHGVLRQEGNGQEKNQYGLNTLVVLNSG